MKSLFSFMTQTALRFRAVTLLLVALLLVAGISGAARLNQELLPPVEFPQTFILAPASGMSSEEVLVLITERLEAELLTIPELLNIDSQTTSAIGAFVIARNDFGQNQQRLKAEIQTAIDRVWFPQRRIEAPQGQDPEAFARRLLAELPAEVLLYLAEADPNFLFQLSPDAWDTLDAEVVRTLLAYLANKSSTAEAGKTALERLVEQEIAPQLRSLDLIADVSVSGGQALPGEEDVFGTAAAAEASTTTQLLQLSPRIWRVVSQKLGGLGELDDAAVEALRAVQVSLPETPPVLPDSWQFPHISSADDLFEMASLFRSVADEFNEFLTTGRIVGPLTRVEDLTPETVTRMLEIAPSLVNYFEGRHLAAMSPEVFAALPDEFIDSLDGFTRDELAAAVLAESITGEAITRDSVVLPAAWRISPPQIISFDLSSDIPLVSFSVAFTGSPSLDTVTDEADESSSEDTAAQSTPVPAPTVEIPEGPPLPALVTLLTEELGFELNTADDLIDMELPESLAGMMGSDTLSAAGFFNLLAAFSNPEAMAALGGAEGEDTPGGLDPSGFDLSRLLPALTACGVNPFELAGGSVDFAKVLFDCIDPEVVAFVVQYDEGFAAELQPEVYGYFSDAVLEIEGLAPPLGSAWNTLSEQPQFAQNPLRTASDLLRAGDGRASVVLNAIHDNIPQRFVGYDVRLFDSLTPVVLRFFALREADFYANLHPEVLLKFSPAGLSVLPEEVLSGLEPELAERLVAIRDGEAPSAAVDLSDLYTSEVVPADPNAPELNPGWAFVAGFIPGAELDKADDFFRYTDALGAPPAGFINNLFNSPGGTSLAPDLIGNLSLEAFNYIAARDPSFVNDLGINALQLLPEEILVTLPESTRTLVADGGERFTPARAVTRTNGSSSLFLTVYKTSDANTVSAFYSALDVMNALDASNPDIEIGIVFEQSSFIESSITGVIREGSLGAVFAIINILVFLSGGLWPARARRVVGIVTVVFFAAALGLLVLQQLDAAGGDIGRAFAQADTVLRILTMLGIVVGFVVLLWPGTLPYPAWRSTIVIGVSIPLSIISSFAIMAWVAPAVHGLVAPLQEDIPILRLLVLLFPPDLTLNIMTLSGLTVAIGRVVDDSIVVLENIFRQLETGMPKREAIISGARDVSAAIASATGIAVVVFLPIGLTGGIVGEIFLPFGLAVTYALLSSFFVAILVVPVLAYILLDTNDVPEESETWMQRAYVPVLRRVLSSPVSRFGVVGIAIVSFFIGGLLFAQRPFTFLPSFGEPEISVNVSLPPGTSILETNEYVRQIETFIREIVPADQLSTLQSIVGGGGASFESLVGGGGGVRENIANITIRIRSQQLLEELTPVIRQRAEELLPEEYVTVSAGTIADTGFSGFDLVVSAPDQETLEALDPIIIAALNELEGITNVSSNLAQMGGGSNGPPTYIRVNSRPALSYSGELETQDTIRLAQEAIEVVRSLPGLPEDVVVSQGFTSEFQTQGFASIFVAIGIASVIVVVILIITFNSPVYWLALFLSVIVAPVGAAVALTVTDRVLGLSSLIGLLMLLGLVITNAIVLIDRVQSNRSERGLELYDALIEAGSRRLRPILMTSIATIIALIPLAVGLSEGAIIAAELGTVVIGGVFSSTMLTLLVVPAMYSLLAPVQQVFSSLFRRNRSS